MAQNSRNDNNNNNKRKKFLGQFDKDGISNWKVTRVPGTWQRGAKFELYKRDGIFVPPPRRC